MTAPARTAAFQALQAIAAERIDLPSALARSRAQLKDERDRALTAEIVNGTLRWQHALDHIAQHVAGRSPAKIDLDVLIILRLSLYQILHLARVPAAAVVDDAVDLTKAARKRSAAAFVNAVLRSTLRQRHRLPLPPRPVDVSDRQAALAYLSITHSHPEWLVRRWLDRYGFVDLERWVRFNNDPPRLTLRANRLRGSREEVARILAAEGIETQPTRYAPDGLVVTAGNPLARAMDGRFVVQDEASQLVALVVAARPGQRVLDLCAAPGNKTTAMAADMSDDGLIVACDVRSRRIALLQRTVALSGARRTRVVLADARGSLPFRPLFDRVLVDVPCSGLGTIRRDPDIRWRRREADLPIFARDQLTVLMHASEALNPGGRLVYATCSSEPEENESVVDAFLRARPEFHAVDLRKSGSPLLRPMLDHRGMFHTLPFEHGLEAFFAAALVRS